MVSTKKHKISVAPTSSSEQVEEAKALVEVKKEHVIFLFAVVILCYSISFLSGQFDEFIVV